MSKSVVPQSHKPNNDRKSGGKKGAGDEGKEDGGGFIQVPPAESSTISTVVSTVPPPVDALIDKLKEDEKMIEVLQFDILTISTTVYTVPATTPVFFAPAMTSQFMFTDDFKRLLVDLVMGDTLMTLRLVTKAWKCVADAFIDERVASGAMIVHGGKDIFIATVQVAKARKESRKLVTRVIFLQNITKVGSHACSYSINLVVVDIPDGIESIGGFGGCASLTTISFPTTLTSICHAAFNMCTSLESVELSHTNLQELGQSAFYCCLELKSMTIPDSLQRLGDHVFHSCDKLVPSSIDVRYDIIYEDFDDYRNDIIDTTAEIVAYLRSKQ